MPLHDITRFSMADMAICSSALRHSGQDASSMEQAAENIVEYLYTHLSDGLGGAESLALVRLFKTQPYGELEEDLQNFARRLLGHEPARSMKCLTLLATRGAKPEWCSRRLSLGHQAIPLVSEEGVARIPMIANLVQQFGLEISQVIEPDSGLLTDLLERTFNVFHVAEAVGSSNIPAQDEFVLPEGIRSCLGFGGVLPRGDLFAVIMFSRVPIPVETASMFKSLSLAVKLALMPFQSRVFD